MQITQTADGYEVPCRRWAAEHMGIEMKYAYRTKRNALRATACPKRNQKTRLAHYAKQCYDRVVHLEIIILSLLSKIKAYDFAEFDAGELVIDCGSVGRDDFEASGDDSRSGSGAAGFSGEGGSSDSGGRSSDTGAGGSVESL